MTEGSTCTLGWTRGAGFVGRALETALREAIRSGRLHAGARLPRSRSLAADLGISRGTVVQPTPAGRTGPGRGSGRGGGGAARAWSRALEAPAEVVQEI